MSEIGINHIIPTRRDKLMVAISRVIVYAALLWEGVRQKLYV